MISRKARQARILEVVGKRPVGSQEELASLLNRDRIGVTQSTLSRDIRELGLVKVRGRYQIPGDVRVETADQTLRRAFSQFIVQMGLSGNIVMIKTAPGNAHSVGVVLDGAQWPEVLGTVAGDDTIFVLLRSRRFGRKVMARIKEFAE